MNNPYFFERAFRSFFLGAMTFAIVAMMVWWTQSPGFNGTFADIAAIHWHGHEMVFGYALATVTGFLLTAVMNWSGMNSACGWPLAFGFLLWCLARLGDLFSLPMEWIAFFDLGFNLMLVVLFAWPCFINLASTIIMAITFGVWFYDGGDCIIWPCRTQHHPTPLCLACSDCRRHWLTVLCNGGAHQFRSYSAQCL